MCSSAGEIKKKSNKQNVLNTVKCLHTYAHDQHLVFIICLFIYKDRRKKSTIKRDLGKRIFKNKLRNKAKPAGDSDYPSFTAVGRQAYIYGRAPNTHIQQQNYVLEYFYITTAICVTQIHARWRSSQHASL